MKKYTFYIAALLIALLIFRRSSAQPPRPDSAEVAKQEAFQKLMQKEFSFNYSLIDSTFKKIENTLTVSQYNQYAGAYRYFVQMMIQTWYEDYMRRKKQK